MTLISLRIGKEDYGRTAGVTLCLFGVEGFVGKNRKRWTVGLVIEWARVFWSHTF